MQTINWYWQKPSAGPSIYFVMPASYWEHLHHVMMMMMMVMATEKLSYFRCGERERERFSMKPIEFSAPHIYILELNGIEWRSPFDSHLLICFGFCQASPRFCSQFYCSPENKITLKEDYSKRLQMNRHTQTRSLVRSFALCHTHTRTQSPSTAHVHARNRWK